MTPVTAGKVREEILDEIRERLIKKHSSLFLKLNNSMDRQLYSEAERVIRKEMEGKTEEECQYVLAHILGLGKLEPLLADGEISEIMVNSPQDVWIYKSGRMIKTDLRFHSDDEVYNLAFRICQRCGKKINFSSPTETARLPDGSRVTITVPPASIHPTITIRRFPRYVFSTEELVSQGFFTEEMAVFLQTAVRGKLNIVVCGGTGTGKTTFMRYLAQYIPENERILTLETTRELKLSHPHCISLEASEKADMYELMLAALHMRPDRILLGEMLGAESFEFLQAAGTGHNGAISSVHTDYYSQSAALNRVKRAMARAGLATSAELEMMISETINIWVFLKRYADGAFRIVNISELSWKDSPAWKTIFLWDIVEKRHRLINRLSPEMTARLRDNLGELPQLQCLGR